MENVGNYILSVVTAALICGIITAMVPWESGRGWIRLLCGLALTVTIIRPLSGIDALDISSLMPSDWTEGSSVSDEGEKLARESMAAIIKEKVRAYILDKASALGITVDADVLVTGDTIPVPVSVDLWGTPTPYGKLQLESLIQEELGITKENIRWME